LQINSVAQYRCDLGELVLISGNEIELLRSHLDCCCTFEAVDEKREKI
jgi:hypothetical protein